MGYVLDGQNVLFDLFDIQDCMGNHIGADISCSDGLTNEELSWTVEMFYLTSKVLDNILDGPILYYLDVLVYV